MTLEAILASRLERSSLGVLLPRSTELRFVELSFLVGGTRAIERKVVFDQVPLKRRVHLETTEIGVRSVSHLCDVG